MLFNSIHFLLFLPIVVIVFYCLPAKVRYLWLLAASYYFYAQWNPVYLLLILGCTIVTYTAALLIETRSKPKAVMAGTLIITLGALCYYKYTPMIMNIISTVLSWFQIDASRLQTMDILLPVGISFFTLQSIGYVIDVWRGDTKAEHNFFRFALFVSFFPQLVAGPIERSKNLLSQLYSVQKLSYENIRRGLLLVGYGLFLKVVIADRAAMIVNTVFEGLSEYTGLYVAIAAFFFAIQIYCDFYGYSVIAKGSALMLGIRLMDNFNAPYFSQSIKEYWSRWHISLSTWFRDYLYIPLGGNRRGKRRTQLNRLIVFAVSGLWHGAALSYVAWGILNALYQTGEDVCKWLMGKWFPDRTCDKNRFSSRLFSTLRSFILFDLAWILFRAGGIRPALLAFRSMFSTFNPFIFFDGSVFTLGVDKNYMAILMVSILILAIVDIQKYKGIDVVDRFFAQSPTFRLIAELSLVFAIVLFGCYGEMYDVQQFIYFQF